MKVDFLIIGAQKSGTTSLANQLSSHDKISISVPKEPHFFSKNVDWKESISEYHSLFSDFNSNICGEASTTYTFSPDFGDVANRIYEYNPDIKLIYIMRHPVERIISQYSHDIVKANNPPGSIESILSDSTYINRSRYGMQLKPYLNRFSRKQILLLIFEEYINNTLYTLENVSSFLGVDFSSFPKQLDMRARNVTSEKVVHSVLTKKLAKSNLVKFFKNKASKKLVYAFTRMIYRLPNPEINIPVQLKQKLWTQLEDDVLIIEHMLGRKIDAWRDKKYIL